MFDFNRAALSSIECQTKTEPDHDKKYGVPSLEELGKSPEDCGPLLFPGGETEALRRMESMIQKKVPTAKQFQKLVPYFNVSRLKFNQFSWHGTPCTIYKYERTLEFDYSRCLKNFKI